MHGNDSCPLLLKNAYSNGTVYVLTIPDLYGDISRYPAAVLTEIRRSLMNGMGLYMEGRADVSLFMYDNGIFTLESIGKHNCTVLMHVSGNMRKLEEIGTGKIVEKTFEVSGESVFRLELEPMMYRSFRVV